jgi:Leucine-rich repeat (LRR) protein
MGNPLEELPRDFGALTSLVRLGLKGCGLRCLPPSFSRLGRLVELFITDNALTSLPEGEGTGWHAGRVGCLR